MTSFTLSTHRSTTFNLAATDVLTVTNQGSIGTIGDPAILGAGANVLSVNGFVSGNGDYAIQFAAGGNSVTVGAGGLLFSNGGAVIRAAGGGNTIVSSGEIVAYAATDIGIQLLGGSNALTLYASSQIRGGLYGIRLEGGFNSIANLGSISASDDHALICAAGGNTIFNGGTIFSPDMAVFMGDGATNTFNNSGIIRSLGGAIQSDSNLVLTNSGTLDGQAAGIYVTSDGTATITNSGYIYGRTLNGMFFEGSHNDVVVNNGFVQSATNAAYLGGGVDFFDGRGGIQIGTVDGASGNDVLYGGAGFDDLRGGAGDDHISGGGGADYLDGGANFDLVRYDFATSAVIVSLANPAINTGEAAGDVLLNFEGITGSNFADTLIGDGGANTIFGGLGADAIVGGGGTDTLSGGAGGDVIFGEAGTDLISGGAGGDIIRGGLGGDLIVFNAGDNGDLILNFNEGGARDGFDLRGYFDATGYAGTMPRAAGIMQVLQNGADTDVYLHGAFAFRIQGVTAAAVDDTYFLFQ